jgi:hypothetical protein
MRFPDAQPVADELLGRSQAFRTLVEEYEMCADTLDGMSYEGASSPLLALYIAERFALERVLLQYLTEERHSDDLC